MAIATIWRPPDVMADFIFGDTPKGRDLATGRALETAVVLSLFTDGLADPADVPPDGGEDRRGWWGDSGLAPGRRLGSRLWLLAREKRTEATRVRAAQYCREALRWLVDDKAASRVDVLAEWNRENPDRLDIAITITRGSAVLLDRRYDVAWAELGQADDNGVAALAAALARSEGYLSDESGDLLQDETGAFIGDG